MKTAVVNRIFSLVLALTMLSCVIYANVTKIVWAEPDTLPEETDYVETEAPETEAPETEAPETEAPETEAPETEAPETEEPVAAIEEPEPTLLLNGELKIGSTTNKITSVSELVTANLDLLRWEAKGSYDKSTITCTFGEDTYTDFSSIYAQIYARLLKYATKTVNSGEQIFTEAQTFSTKNSFEIIKISGTVILDQSVSLTGNNSRVVIVSDGPATIEVKNTTGEFTLSYSGTTSKLSIQGLNDSNRITVEGSKTLSRAGVPLVTIKGGSLHLNNVVLQNFLYGTSESNNSVIFVPNGSSLDKYMYMSNSVMQYVEGYSSPGIFLQAYKSQSSVPKSYLYFYNNTFQYCKTRAGTTYAGGPVIRSYAADNSQLRMEKCYFYYNENNSSSTGAGAGAIFWKSASGNAVLTDCEFKYNYSATSGGAIYNVGNMEIKGCTFENNTAAKNGGAIAVEPPNTSVKYPSINTDGLSGSLTLDSKTVINNNTATNGDGGAIYFRAYQAKIGTGVPLTNYTMTLELDGSEITNNKATAGNGGAIAIFLDYGTSTHYTTGVTIKAGDITGNTAGKNGGAIWMGSAANCNCTNASGVDMQGGTLSGNTAAGNGGAIYIQTGKVDDNIKLNFTMSNGTVINNTATGNGGAVYIEGGNFTISGGNLGVKDTSQGEEYGKNQAVLGGGVYLNRGSATVTGGSVQHNKATNGGGIYVSGGNVTVSGTGTIQDNIATNGGGVYLTGGEFILDSAETYIKNNTAENGGGVYLTKISPALRSGNIIDNTAYASGGGIFIDKKEVILAPTGTVTFDGNKATDGAGMYISGEEGNLAGFSMDDTATGSVVFSGNIASGNGGGVCLSYGNMAITDEHIQLFGNEAENGGGAAVLNGSFDLSGGSVGVTDENANTATNGGGIYVSGGNVTVSGTGTILNNEAKNGGGVYLTGGEFILNGAKTYIKNNTATNGGGVYLTKISPDLLSGNIIDNTAYASGGGIFIDKQVVTLTPTGIVIFDGNEATDGAGMYISGEEGDPAGAGFSVSECIGRVVFSSNAASENGGGVCINNGSFSIDYDNIDIISNTAVNGGGVAVLSGTFNMKAGSIGENAKSNTAENGGGVYVAGTATIEGGAVSYNTATNGGGVYVASTTTADDKKSDNLALYDGIVSYNTATNGGGFYVKNGSFTMYGGTITQNVAQNGNGGGGIVAGGNFVMKDGTIGGAEATDANTALNGGGIYVSDGNVTIQYGTISHNLAQNDGGGIYVSSDITEANVIFLSGELTNNTAKEGNGGGLAVRSTTGQKITVEIGCLLDHPKNEEGELEAFVYDGKYVGYAPAEHESCPHVSGNIAAVNGGGVFIKSASSELYFYCIKEDNNKANGNTNCYSLDVEGGYVSIGDKTYHTNPEERPAGKAWGDVYMSSTVLVNDGYVEIFGDMENPYFADKITVDIQSANGKFVDHRRDKSEKVSYYKIHYFENFKEEGDGEEDDQAKGKYIAIQYPVDYVDDQAQCKVAISGNAFERPGYKITRWIAIYTDENNEKHEVEYAVGETYDLTKLTAEEGMGAAKGDCPNCDDDDYCLVLLAKWEKKGYVIKFDPNSPPGATCTGTMEDLPCTQGVGVTLRKNQFKCEGYIFDGWNRDRYATGQKYADEQEVKDLTLNDSEEITLYAQWKKCTHKGHLVYTVENGNTIIEFCEACEGHIAYAYLNAEASDIPYDAKEHPVIITGDYGTENWLGEEYKLVYTKDYDPVWDQLDSDGVCEEWGTGSEKAPIYAGTYTATIKVDGVKEEFWPKVVFMISPVEWGIPPESEYVVVTVDNNRGIQITSPTLDASWVDIPTFEYCSERQVSDGIVVNSTWSEDKFIATATPNTYYYVYSRLKADRNHTAVEVTGFLTYLSENASVEFILDKGVEVAEANVEGNNKFTFKAGPAPGYHKSNWSVILYKKHPSVATEEDIGNVVLEDDNYILTGISLNQTYYVKISGVTVDAKFSSKAKHNQEFANFEGVSEVKISRDSSFTVRYLLENFTPGEYGELSLVFEDPDITTGSNAKNLPVGTKIIMIKDGTYWYYITTSQVSSISLTSFKKMGAAGQFAYDTDSSPINSLYQFVFDFSDAATKLDIDKLDVKLSAETNPVGATVLNESCRIELFDEATFDLKAEFADTGTITYAYTASAGHASIWNNRKSAIVITLGGTLPADLVASIGVGAQTTDYKPHNGNQFIVPCGALVDGSTTLNVKFKSELVNVINCAKITVSWIVSDSPVDVAPFGGTTVSQVACEVTNGKITISNPPALRIIGVAKERENDVRRLCKIGEEYEVRINTLNIPGDWAITMYLYRKDTTVGSQTEGKFVYTGFNRALTGTANSKLSLAGQEEGTFYLYVVATKGEDANRVIVLEDKYFFIAEN